MMTKLCTDCNKEFEITDAELTQYEKVGLELPIQCFFCRVKQHFAFWNFGKFRKAVSALSGESLITVLPMEPRYPIYKKEEWWSDAWDPLSFGQEYDSTRPFFEQLKELQEKIPRPHQLGENSVACDWCDDVWEAKNCYLTRSVLRTENLIYGYRDIDVKDSVDITLSNNLSNSYDCFFCHDSFNLISCENCRNCLDSSFLFDCRNCTSCFMCWNLRGKSYCIENVQYTKDEYLKKISEYDLGSYQVLQQLKKNLALLIQKEAVHKEHFNIKTENSVGNFLVNCEGCINAFTWETSQNCYNCVRGLNSKDSIDLTGTWNVEVSGNNSCVTGGYGIKYSSWSDARYSEYLDLCYDVEYCFGCIGLRKKKYCILNKQYTKEEYTALKAVIIDDMKTRGEYGKYLPYSMGVCDYNLSSGIIYFPEASEDEIVSRGGYWYKGELGSSDGIPSSSLPDNIKDAPSDISTQALLCVETGYRYNIASPELEFYKNKNIALPRTHFDVRTLERIRKAAVLKAYPYVCCYCNKEVQAYYPPEWGYQKIACEECYQQNLN
jgi:hypothetical protein